MKEKRGLLYRGCIGSGEPETAPKFSECILSPSLAFSSNSIHLNLQFFILHHTAVTRIQFQEMLTIFRTGLETSSRLKYSSGLANNSSRKVRCTVTLFSTGIG